MDVERILRRAELRSVFQPLYSLRSGRVAGLEALTRFTAPDSVSPAATFAGAHARGLGVELELAALECALTSAVDLPPEVALWVNLSPACLRDARAVDLLAGGGVPRLGVEVTEQSALGEAGERPGWRARLREAGIALAVDDLGAGRAGMQRVRRLGPDQLKAGRALTASLDRPRPRTAVARQLVRAARRHGAGIVAEGVETPAQLAAWRRLGADLVQGFLLAAPGPLEQALDGVPIRAAGGRLVPARP